MKNILVKHTDSIRYLQRLKYVLDFLNNHPLNQELSFILTPASHTDLTIGYGTGDEHFQMVSQKLFFDNPAATVSRYFANKYTFNQEELYSVEPIQQEPQVFYSGTQIGFDVFETIFFHISRYEEVFSAPEDNNQAGWRKEALHFLIQNQLQSKAVVDQLVKAFLQLILQTTIQKRTTYDLTHDLDILTRFTPAYKFFRSLGTHLIYRRKSKQLWQNIAYFRSMQRGDQKDPYDSFNYLFCKENYWSDKILYLMAGGNSKYDNKYQLNDRAVDDIIGLAKQRGYKIGLHPSYNAAFDYSMYSHEKALLETKIKQTVAHSRQHWLRFNWSVTPFIFEENGIEVDASMGYSTYLGFRCGTGFAYHLYDFKNEKPFSWKEQPLVFMDSAAIHQAIRTDTNLTDLMTRFIQDNLYHTHISFNFHNSNFDPLTETGIQLIDFYQNKLIALLNPLPS